VLALALALALGCSSSKKAAPAAPQSPSFSSSDVVEGKTLGNWGAAWWQWMANVPVATNPLPDTTGEFCALGQAGPVWFLAASDTNGVVQRACTIPPDKDVFFPILTSFWCVDPSDPNFDSLDKIRAWFDYSYKDATMSATLDGNPLTNLASYRARSDVFTMTLLADDNYLGAPAGDYPDCLADGYQVMLRPLSRGLHTLRFTENASVLGSSVDVTYQLTVGP
jgi:hypothetical protein